jgi:ATP-dependent RNA helicase DeaD
MLIEEGGEEDLAAAKALLAVRSAEDVAKAFIRLYRGQKPAPEDLVDPGIGGRERRPARADGKREPAGAGRRTEHEPRSSVPSSSQGSGAHGSGNSVWFRLNVGRQKKADPKWLLPEICRQGKVTKPDIGAIRIFDDETRFEINEDAAGRFAEAIRSAKGSEIRIEPSTKPDMNAPERRKALADEKPREQAEIPDPNAKYKKRSRPFGGKPHAGKPYAGKPSRHREHGAKEGGKPARRRP